MNFRPDEPREPEAGGCAAAVVGTLIMLAVLSGAAAIFLARHAFGY